MTLSQFSGLIAIVVAISVAFAFVAFCIFLLKFGIRRSKEREIDELLKDGAPILKEYYYEPDYPDDDIWGTATEEEKREYAGWYLDSKKQGWFF